MNKLLKTHLEDINSEMNKTLTNEEVEQLDVQLESLHKLSNQLEKEYISLENLEDVIGEVKEIINQQNINLSEIKEENQITEEQDNTSNEQAPDEGEVINTDSNGSNNGGDKDSPIEEEDNPNTNTTDDNLDSDDVDSGDSDTTDENKSNESDEEPKDQSNDESIDKTDQNDDNKKDNKDQSDEEKDDKKVEEKIANECLRLYSCLGALGISFNLEDISNENLFNSIGCEYDVSKTNKFQMYKSHNESFLHAINKLGQVAIKGVKEFFKRVLEFLNFIGNKLFDINKISTTLIKEIQTILDKGEFIDAQNKTHPLNKQLNMKKIKEGGVFDFNLLEKINEGTFENNFDTLMSTWKYASNKSNTDIPFINLWISEMIGKSSRNKLIPLFMLKNSGTPIYFTGRNKGYSIHSDENNDIYRIEQFDTIDNFSNGNQNLFTLNNILISIQSNLISGKFLANNQTCNDIKEVMKWLKNESKITEENNRGSLLIGIMIIKDCLYYTYNIIRSFKWIRNNIENI